MSGQHLGGKSFSMHAVVSAMLALLTLIGLGCCTSYVTGFGACVFGALALLDVRLNDRHPAGGLIAIVSMVVGGTVIAVSIAQTVHFSISTSDPPDRLVDPPHSQIYEPVGWRELDVAYQGDKKGTVIAYRGKRVLLTGVLSANDEREQIWISPEYSSEVVRCDASIPVEELEQMGHPVLIQGRIGFDGALFVSECAIVR